MNEPTITPEWKRTIVHMPGTRLGPEVVLARTQTKVSRIKAVAVGILWDDDSVSMDWSSMPVSMLCMLSRWFDELARRQLIGEASDDLEG